MNAVTISSQCVDLSVDVLRLMFSLLRGSGQLVIPCHAVCHVAWLAPLCAIVPKMVLSMICCSAARSLELWVNLLAGDFLLFVLLVDSPELSL